MPERVDDSVEPTSGQSIPTMIIWGVHLGRHTPNAQGERFDYTSTTKVQRASPFVSPIFRTRSKSISRITIAFQDRQSATIHIPLCRLPSHKKALTPNTRHETPSLRAARSRAKKDRSDRLLFFLQRMQGHPVPCDAPPHLPLVSLGGAVSGDSFPMPQLANWTAVHTRRALPPTRRPRLGYR